MWYVLQILIILAGGVFMLTYDFSPGYVRPPISEVYDGLLIALVVGGYLGCRCAYLVTVALFELFRVFKRFQKRDGSSVDTGSTPDLAQRSLTRRQQLLITKPLLGKGIHNGAGSPDVSGDS